MARRSFGSGLAPSAFRSSPRSSSAMASDFAAGLRCMYLPGVLRTNCGVRRCLPEHGETIRKSRFTDEQIVKVPREADAAPVSEVVKKYRVQEQTLYVWRKRVGTMTVPDRAGREAAEWSRSPSTPTWSCQLDEAARRAPSFTCGAPLTGYQAFRAQSANSERLAIAGGGSLASPRSWPGLPRHAALGLYTIHSPRALAGHVIGRVRALVMILLRGEADPLRHLATHLPEDCPVSRTSARQRLPAIALVMTSVLIAGCIGSTPSDSGGKNPPFRAPVTAPSPATPGGPPHGWASFASDARFPGGTSWCFATTKVERCRVSTASSGWTQPRGWRPSGGSTGLNRSNLPTRVLRVRGADSEADALAASQDPDVAFVEEDGEIWAQAAQFAASSGSQSHRPARRASRRSLHVQRDR